MVSRFRAAAVIAVALSLAFAPVVATAAEFDDAAPSPVDDFSPRSIAPLTPADFGVSVPPGASVETFASPDGSIAIVVTEKLDAVESAELVKQSAELSRGESLVTHDDNSTSMVSRVAAACTQSSSVTDPAVVTSSGSRYARSIFKLGRSSGCAGTLTWYASLWATKGYFQQIEEKSAGTPPGITTQVTVMSYCSGTASTFWSGQMRWAGGLIQREDAHISCEA